MADATHGCEDQGVDVERAREIFLSTDAPFAPRIFTDAPRHWTLRARLQAADEMLGRLSGAGGGSLVESLLRVSGQPREVRRVMHAAKLPRQAADPIVRSYFGLDDERFTGWGAYAQARLAACLAAELIWFFYAQGVVAARDASPVDSLRTDMQALAKATTWFAVVDYPAVALAFGAALQCDDGPPGRWEAFAALVRTLVDRHIGGKFASATDRDLVKSACDRIADHLVRRLSGAGVPPFFTAPSLAGLLVEEIDNAVPHLELASADYVGDYEDAANRLVFETLKSGAPDPEVLRALDELHQALQVELDG